MSIFATVPWIVPSLSALNLDWPCLISLTAFSMFSVTVPDFGFGMSPLGPKIFASLLTSFIIDGVVIATSKSIGSLEYFSIKSSEPTKSAPADFASATLSASTKTATLTSLPKEFGNGSLTFLIRFLGQFSFTATSTDSKTFFLVVKLVA